MTEDQDQATRELLALTAPDPGYPRIDREYVRAMLAEAWALGYVAAAKELGGWPDTAPPEDNPFRQP